MKTPTRRARKNRVRFVTEQMVQQPPTDDFRVITADIALAVCSSSGWYARTPAAWMTPRIEGRPLGAMSPRTPVDSRFVRDIQAHQLDRCSESLQLARPQSARRRDHQWRRPCASRLAVGAAFDLARSVSAPLAPPSARNLQRQSAEPARDEICAVTTPFERHTLANRKPCKTRHETASAAVGDLIIPIGADDLRHEAGSRVTRRSVRVHIDKATQIDEASVASDRANPQIGACATAQAGSSLTRTAPRVTNHESGGTGQRLESNSWTSASAEPQPSACDRSSPSTESAAPAASRLHKSTMPRHACSGVNAAKSNRRDPRGWQPGARRLAHRSTRSGLRRALLRQSLRMLRARVPWRP